jgi:hypothetical protein
MNTLSTITILPSTRKEADNYLSKLKSEILATNDLSWETNIEWFSWIVKKLYQDKKIYNHIVDVMTNLKK